MNNAVNICRRYIRKILVLFLLATVTSLSATSVEPACDCMVPSGTMTDHGSSSASFSWNAVGGATEYQIWYVQKDNNHSSSIISTGNTSVTISGFSPGTYTVYLRTVCGGSMSGSVIIADDLLMI